MQSIPYTMYLLCYGIQLLPVHAYRILSHSLSVYVLKMLIFGNPLVVYAFQQETQKKNPTQTPHMYASYSIRVITHTHNDD